MIGRLLAISIPAFQPLHAAALTLDLPGEGERRTIAYDCSDGTERAVEYVNLAQDSLALLAIDGSTRLFVNVVAASGAKYVSGSEIWWTKGAEATLSNEMAEEDSAPMTCIEQESRG